MQLQDQVAVITGGGSGIGRALALAREGADVVIANLDEGSAEAVSGEVRALGRRALAVRTDVSREDEIAALVERVLERENERMRRFTEQVRQS